MNEQKISHFKNKLDAELKLVESELKELGWKNPSTGEWEATGGDIDASATENDELADKQEEYEERREEIEPLEARWNEIKLALDKIDEGTFGTCENCGEPIEPDRLEANPAARTCKTHM
jgi:RNA polymerase-binding transcription factor DksA